MINIDLVPDLYDATKVQAVPKGPGRYFCLTCKKTLDEKQFFKTNREKHKAGILPDCKSCLTMMVDDTSPESFLPILKEVNVPFIPSEWRKLLVKKDSNSASVLGKYVSKMRLNQFKKYKWIDTENLIKEDTDAILTVLRMEEESETEAQQKLEEMMSFKDVIPEGKKAIIKSDNQNQAMLYGLTPQTSKYNLTEEEISQLQQTWGTEYNEDQYLALEQQYQDMQEAYVIADPIAVSNARIICKMTQKMHHYLDIDDVESVSKLGRQLDLFIKSANLAPVQQKDRQQTTFAISQLAFLVEREGGFIPKYYSSKPQDKIDMTLQDMKEYTYYLIQGESNIEEMVKNTEMILAQDKLPEAVEDFDDFAALEKELLGDIEAIEESQLGEEDAITD